jgi:flagellar export protein FliJ
MAFRYPLQSLLRLRESLERQEEQRLYRAAAAVVQLRTKLEELERERAGVHRAALQAEGQEIFGATLQFVAACDEAAAVRRVKLQAQLVEAEQHRQEQLRVYQSARQKREIFQGLREQQKAIYDQELARLEQELADEMFLIRRHGNPSE